MTEEINVDLTEEEATSFPEQNLNPQEQAAQERALEMGRTADEVSGFKVPTDFVSIPSGGKVYPPNSPLHKVTELEVKFLTAQDEDILTSRSLLRSGKAIDAVLSNCLIDKRINPEDFLSGDKNALVTFLRVSGYGPEYSVDMDCPDCNQNSNFKFDLSQLEMKTLDIDPIADGQNRFALELPSGIMVEFKFLNSAEEREISDAQEKLKKTTNSPLDKNITTRLKNLLLSVNGEVDPGYINQFVDTLNVRDSRALRKHIGDNTPDVDMEQSFECSYCGHKGEVDIPITVGFFWPDA